MDRISRKEATLGRYVVATWTDDRGDNTLAGIIRKVEPLTVLSLTGHGYVEVPITATLRSGVSR